MCKKTTKQKQTKGENFVKGRIQNISIIVALAALALAGCKKHVGREHARTCAGARGPSCA
jgi:hypothetical protein